MGKFAANQMQLEMIILSEERKREMPYDITYMWNLKYDVNEPVCETEAESYIRIDWQLPRLAWGGS